MSDLPLKYDAQGLVPAVVQDRLTGEIRMFAFATEAAVRTTVETGRATFWSRSRGELWQRSRIGGLEVPVARVLADCDADCIIYSSDPQGPSCHSGAPSCFFQTLDGGRLSQVSEPPQTLLATLEASLRASPGSSPEPNGSSGPPLPSDSADKVRSEAGALADSLARGSDADVVAKAADTLYELLAGLGSRSIPLRRVLAELARRRAPDVSPA
jgi:phosphoribosyl-ATP pyrophosphohydrolase/phosphoribosyl-AMP cyclohydrolase